MRNPKDDVMARGAAEHKLAELLASTPDGPAGDGGLSVRQVVGELGTVEFERTVSKVRGGTEVPLRRLVITSAWEVDPSGGLAEGWNAGQAGSGKSAAPAE